MFCISHCPLCVTVPGQESAGFCSQQSPVGLRPGTVKHTKDNVRHRTSWIWTGTEFKTLSWITHYPKRPFHRPQSYWRLLRTKSSGLLARYGKAHKGQCETQNIVDGLGQKYCIDLLPNDSAFVADKTFFQKSGLLSHPDKK